ncbi:hypothetical protein JHK82_047507 [Glycine max]|nr:hypothetical protein JHK82_047507 [Glycine max]
MDDDSSVLSSVTTLFAHGTRDLREVVEEIQDEFVTTSNFRKEVALVLEVCKRPYRSKVVALRGMVEPNAHAIATMTIPVVVVAVSHIHAPPPCPIIADLCHSVVDFKGRIGSFT